MSYKSWYYHIFYRFLSNGQYKSWIEREKWQQSGTLTPNIFSLLSSFFLSCSLHLYPTHIHTQFFIILYSLFTSSLSQFTYKITLNSIQETTKIQIYLDWESFLFFTFIYSFLLAIHTSGSASVSGITTLYSGSHFRHIFFCLFFLFSMDALSLSWLATFHRQFFSFFLNFFTSKNIMINFLQAQFFFFFFLFKNIIFSLFRLQTTEHFEVILYFLFYYFS